jgi:putative ABC transport system permease protein
VTAFWWFVREWKAGEISVLAIALILSVTMVTGISLFTDRLSLRVVGESKQFLAADLAVEARGRLEQTLWAPIVQDTGLDFAETVSFPSMLQTGTDEFALVSIKAVSEKYPLRGQLTVSDGPFESAHNTASLPNEGEIWIAPRLFPLLNLDIGGEVTIGEAQFRVSGVIRSEPDGGGSMFDSAPRVLMSLSDLDRTHILQPGSRLGYRLLLAGDPDALVAAEGELEAVFGEEIRIRSVSESQPSIAQALDRAERFLLLAGACGVLLSGVAMMMAARRFSERHFAYVAVFKSLGATRRDIALLYVGLLSCVGSIALGLGFIAAVGLEQTVLWVLRDMIDSTIPVAFPVAPFLLGTATLLVCLVSFVAPSFFRLTKAPPMRVLRQDMVLQPSLTRLDLIVALSGLTLLTWLYTDNPVLVVSLLMGVASLVALGWLSSRTLVRGFVRILPDFDARWRIAKGNLRRHSDRNGFNLIMFGVAIMLMVLLTLVRTSLIDRWQSQLPEDAPNHFVLNLQDADVQRFSDFLAGKNLSNEAIFPMSRARLIAINGESLAGNEGPRRQRETNFSWTAELPATNELVSGSWWSEDSVDEVSLDREYAERAGIVVGDTLRYLIGADELDLRVSSLREVDWQSLQPNFFVLVEPNVVGDVARTYLTSFYLPPEDKGLLNDLIRAFPTATVLEIDLIIDQIRSIVSSVSKAVEGVLLLIIVAGVLVLVMGISSTLGERRHESAVLKALGARSSDLASAVWIEFGTLGVLSALLGLGAAELAVWRIHESFFDTAYESIGFVWLMVLALAPISIALVGWLSCRRSVSAEPIHALREVGS